MPRTVAYYYDEELGNFNYGGGNPMRPHRVRLTHSLVDSYGLPKRMVVHRPNMRSGDELQLFHADDYVNFLASVTPDNQDEYMAQMRRFNLGAVGEADCPVFDGLFEYCRVYSGGSVNGAAMMNAGNADICLNWAGGMHHAKKAEASGFCYVNDIVLAILELLKKHDRVLYVDIDIHHGDGVEEAFYATDRVMTVSFHKYGDFFPGTGATEDVGVGRGQNYSINVPLAEGMDDESYHFMFEPIMQQVMEKFQPGAIVVCGGADSLSGDRLGCFNLSLDGHSHCVEFLGRFNIPMLILGGGGYTMRNVARCWCYESGRMLGLELPDVLPEKAMREYGYFGDTGRLRITVSNMKNANTREALEKTKLKVLQHLAALPAKPSAQMQERVPDAPLPELPEGDMEVRGGGAAAEEARVASANGYDSDDGGEGAPRSREDTALPEVGYGFSPAQSRAATPGRAPPPGAPSAAAQAQGQQAPAPLQHHGMAQPAQADGGASEMTHVEGPAAAAPVEQQHHHHHHQQAPAPARRSPSPYRGAAQQQQQQAPQAPQQLQQQQLLHQQQQQQPAPAVGPPAQLLGPCWTLQAEWRAGSVSMSISHGMLSARQQDTIRRFAVGSNLHLEPQQLELPGPCSQLVLTRGGLLLPGSTHALPLSQRWTELITESKLLQPIMA